METLKVLVVDDEPGIRLGVARVLRGFTVRVPDLNGEVGFEIAEAETGEEALAALETAAPDILLLDHKLPGISGIQVLEKVSQQPHDWLAVMITAYATIETAVQATKRGAHDFLAKPFTPEELKSTLYKAAKHLILQRHARRLAAEKRMVRFQFISVLSHELKAPLAAVEGYLRLVRDRVVEPGSAKSDEILERSMVRIDGMRSMIADLLDLTRIESGTKRRELAAVDLREAARRAIEMASVAAAPRGIEIALDAGAPVELTADPGEIEIVLNNLLSNAVKYNRDGGRVGVELRSDGSAVVLRVSDTGIGMSQEEAAKLFGEFVRIRNAKTRNILGSGLGLSIVRKLVQLAGGEIAVSSRPDVGTTFTVTLPREPAAAATAAPAIAEAAAP
ncbi:MAG TPA: ATP-binding protein [Thermoanaerobaculaceae bacterium]|nr:ATP-binding protein [Thermoanaerobaculaceae bacterium]